MDARPAVTRASAENRMLANSAAMRSSMARMRERQQRAHSLSVAALRDQHGGEHRDDARKSEAVKMQGACSARENVAATLGGQLSADDATNERSPPGPPRSPPRATHALQRSDTMLFSRATTTRQTKARGRTRQSPGAPLRSPPGRPQSAGCGWRWWWTTRTRRRGCAHAGQRAGRETGGRAAR